MLTTIKLKNFRKHENLELNFGPGFHVIRGANEAGKSTLITGIIYALYGWRCLGQPLEEVVTWGKSPNSLQVELEFISDNTKYHLRRSKSGAELRWDKQAVVGQTETTRAIERIFGVNAEIASKLMMAPQGAIRGALMSGAKDASVFIEDLAGFDVLDRIVELIVEKLPTGQPKLYEERVELLTQQLSMVTDGIGEWDENVSMNAITPLQRKVELLRDKRQRLETQKAAVYDNYIKAITINMNISSLDREIQEAPEKIYLFEAQANAYIDAHPLKDFDNALAEAQIQVGLARKAIVCLEAKNRLDLWKYIGVYINGSYSDLELKLGLCQGDLLRLKQASATLDANIANLKNHIVVSGNCPTCGRQFGNDNEIKAHNAQQDNEKRLLESQLQAVMAESRELDETISAWKNALAADRTLDRLIEQFKEYYSVDRSTVPARVIWNGEWAFAATSVEDAEANLALVQRERDEFILAKGKAEALLQQAENIRARVLEAEIERDKHISEFKPFEADYNSYQRLQSEQWEIETELAKEEPAFTQLLSEHQRKKEIYYERRRTINIVREQLDEARSGLKSLQFNNALLKKVRSSRPAIADKLWSMVLGAASHFFSQMRGARSVVERHGSCFKVDGQPIDGLSGSTLDILGLSLRLALTKTFMPQASFLILDEPAAACDEERELALLAAVSGADFQQILMVTHSSIGERVADAMIELL